MPIKKLSYVIILLLFCINIRAQVPNDDCASATLLGNLPNPVNCGPAPQQNGQGAPVTFNNLTNIIR